MRERERERERERVRERERERGGGKATKKEKTHETLDSAQTQPNNEQPSLC